MASSYIQNYLNDTSIPAEKRKYVMDSINSGMAEKDFESALTQKYGQKYAQKSPTPSTGGLGATLSPEQQQAYKNAQYNSMVPPHIRLTGDLLKGTGEALFGAAKGVTEGLQQAGRAGEQIAVAGNLGQARKGMSQEQVSQANPYNIASDLFGGTTKALKSAGSAAFAPVSGAMSTLPEPVRTGVTNVAKAPFALQGNLLKGAGGLFGVSPEDMQKFVVEPLETAEMLYAITNPAHVKAGATKAVKASKAKVQSGSGKAADYIYEKAIPMSKQEAGMLQKFKAGVTKVKPNITANTARKYGVAGGEVRMGVQAAKKANQLWKKEIAPAVKKVKTPVRTKDLMSTVQTKINKIADPSRRSTLTEALDALKMDYKGLKEASLATWQKIKSEKSKFLPNKAWKGKEIGGAFQEVNKMFTDAIRSKTYSLIKDPFIRQRYLDYGNFLNLMELGQKAMTNAGLKGGTGSFISTLTERAKMPGMTGIGKGLNIISGRTKTLQ